MSLRVKKLLSFTKLVFHAASPARLPTIHHASGSSSHLTLRGVVLAAGMMRCNTEPMLEQRVPSSTMLSSWERARKHEGWTFIPRDVSLLSGLYSAIDIKRLSTPTPMVVAAA